jgi:FkbM family methyltransferase
LARNSSTTNDDYGWVPVGLSGITYRMVRLLFGNPYRRPRLRKLLFGKHIFGGVTVRQRTTNATLHVNIEDYIPRELVESGGYETETLALALSILKSGGTFIDIGANIGLFSIPASKLEGVDVISVDGSIPALSQLYRNMELSGSTLRLVATLVGMADGLAELSVPCLDNLSAARVSDPLGRNAKTINLASFTTLESIIHLAHGKRPKLIKIDVEGAEFEVIQSFDWNSPSRPENIIVELWIDHPSAHSAFDLLVSMGYEARKINGEPIFGLCEIPECNVWFRDINLAHMPTEH